MLTSSCRRLPLTLTTDPNPHPNPNPNPTPTPTPTQEGKYTISLSKMGIVATKGKVGRAPKPIHRRTPYSDLLELLDDHESGAATPIRTLTLTLAPTLALTLILTLTYCRHHAALLPPPTRPRLHGHRSAVRGI